MRRILTTLLLAVVVVGMASITKPGHGTRSGKIVKPGHKA